ncbi:hybrid sensor histidine kinase/response regulator [Noviherbaspirillum aerium]|uniref:hybrid sensor histidine kinase/response regulator n=1 Tax=Noviherbaspirillum aerium TaxID=2588497 RepID=UPI00178C42EC|nr:ATP-binding protein [Noviherbaspirillum aerium]
MPIFSSRGEIARQYLGYDWKTSPLGIPDAWPPVLRNTVNLILHSAFPMFVLWGERLHCLYNDAYVGILDGLHPASFATPFFDIWPEVETTIAPIIARTMAGESIFFENMPVLLDRTGYPDQAWFTFSYSPLMNEHGTIQGVLCTCMETTRQARVEQRQSFQLAIAERLRGLSNLHVIAHEASRLLARQLGVSDVVLGEVDEAGGTIRLNGRPSDGSEGIGGIDVRSIADLGEEMLSLLRNGSALVIDDLQDRGRNAWIGNEGRDRFARRWAGDVRSFVIVPIIRNHELRALLFAEHGQPRSWLSHEVDLIKDAAEYTWLVIEQARAETALQESVTALEQLNRVSESVHSELLLEPLLQKVTDAAVKITGAEFGAFFHNVVDEQGESYMLYTISGVPRESFSGFPMPRNTSIFAPTFGGANIKRSDDITRDPDYGKSAPYEGMPPGHLPVRSYLAAPVKSRDGQVFGGIFLGHAQPGRFTAAHERLLHGISVQAAIGIINSRLYRETQTLLKAEREARANAERESRLKEEFLSVLSHELRTPLNAIAGWSELLRMQRAGDADLQKALTVIDRNARAQARIIDDLLDISRIISGNLLLDNKHIETAQLVYETVESLRVEADAKQIRIELSIDGSAIVYGDAARLQQALSNLLTNAIKFSMKGGVVRIVLESDATHVRIVVADRGRGIDPAFLPYVFERFRQADGSISRQFGGLGLGLAIVKSLVELHGGRVEAASDGIDRGARFTIELPVVMDGTAAAQGKAIGAAEPWTAAADRPAALRGIRVLVIDDEPDTRELLSNVLGDAGAIVRVASSVSMALEQISIERPDLVLSDIGMPNEDGYAFIARLRAMEREQGLPQLPAAALTAFARPEDMRRALDAGFQMHLSKPLALAAVISAVESLAGR